MMKKNISKIVKRYLSGRFSIETEEKIQRWIIKDEEQDTKESASLEYWNSLDIAPDSKTYSALDRVNQRIEHSQMQPIKVSLYTTLGRIAAIIIPLLVIAGGYLYYSKSTDNLEEIFVAYGKEKYLVLPDSSEIWVNAGTTIKYPKEFKGDKRTVYLNGEAYFSVRKDASKPFIVETNNLSVKVLGTKFNVKAYANDSRTITTLTSGKVEVNTVTKASRILKPNEQLSYDNETLAIDIKAVSADETQGWIDGNLIFVDASLDEIIQTLERHFDVSIVLIESNTSQKQKLYTVKFLKNENLKNILNILSDIVGNFSVQKQEGKIILNMK